MSNEIRRAARIIPAVRNNGGRRVVSFLPVRAGFDAASRSPESMRHFAGANFLSADAALSPDVRKTIISRVRNEVVNNGYAWGILDTLAEHCIGTGPRCSFSPGRIATKKPLMCWSARWSAGKNASGNGAVISDCAGNSRSPGNPRHGTARCFCGNRSTRKSEIP